MKAKPPTYTSDQFISPKTTENKPLLSKWTITVNKNTIKKLKNKLNNFFSLFLSDEGINQVAIRGSNTPFSNNIVIDISF